MDLILRHDIRCTTALAATSIAFALLLNFFSFALAGGVAVCLLAVAIRPLDKFIANCALVVAAAVAMPGAETIAGTSLGSYFFALGVVYVTLALTYISVLIIRNVVNDESSRKEFRKLAA